VEAFPATGKICFIGSGGNYDRLRHVPLVGYQSVNSCPFQCDFLFHRNDDQFFVTKKIHFLVAGVAIHNLSPIVHGIDWRATAKYGHCAWIDTESIFLGTALSY